MKLTWRTEWPQWLLLAAMFALAAASWGSAPERIPVHWGIDGRVDRYGGRFEGLFAMPLVALGLYLAMLMLPRIDPRRENYPAFAGAYTTIRLAVIAMLAALYGVVHLWISGREVRMLTVMPVLLGALFVAVGIALGRLESNWFFGIRTPWTLSSERAWKRTHRAGARLFIALGVVTMLLGLFGSAWAIAVMLVMVLAAALALVVYSYIEWRRDPAKAPPRGAPPA